MEQHLKDLGKVTLTMNGTWDSGRTYERLCCVNWNDTSYISRHDGVDTEPIIGGDEHWHEVVQLSDIWDAIAALEKRISIVELRLDSVNDELKELRWATIDENNPNSLISMINSINIAISNINYRIGKINDHLAVLEETITNIIKEGGIIDTRIDRAIEVALHGEDSKDGEGSVYYDINNIKKDILELKEILEQQTIIKINVKLTKGINTVPFDYRFKDGFQFLGAIKTVLGDGTRVSHKVTNYFTPSNNNKDTRHRNFNYCTYVTKNAEAEVLTSDEYKEYSRSMLTYNDTIGWRSTYISINVPCDCYCQFAVCKSKWVNLEPLEVGDIRFPDDPDYVPNIPPVDTRSLFSAREYLEQQMVGATTFLGCWGGSYNMVHIVLYHKSDITYIDGRVTMKSQKDQSDKTYYSNTITDNKDRILINKDNWCQVFNSNNYINQIDNQQFVDNPIRLAVWKNPNRLPVYCRQATDGVKTTHILIPVYSKSDLKLTTTCTRWVVKPIIGGKQYFYDWVSCLAFLTSIGFLADHYQETYTVNDVPVETIDVKIGITTSENEMIIGSLYVFDSSKGNVNLSIIGNNSPEVAHNEVSNMYAKAAITKNGVQKGLVTLPHLSNVVTIYCTKNKYRQIARIDNNKKITLGNRDDIDPQMCGYGSYRDAASYFNTLKEYADDGSEIGLFLSDNEDREYFNECTTDKFDVKRQWNSITMNSQYEYFKNELLNKPPYTYIK